MEKYGPIFIPKNVLLHIGTRDTENNGIKDHEFTDLLETCVKIWPHAKIYISLIMERQDEFGARVPDANRVILSVCELFPELVVVDQFHPEDDMFYNEIDLNNMGLGAMVKHLKTAMGLSRPNQNNNRKISPQGSQHRTDYKANDQGQKRSVPQQQRIFPKSDDNNNANERPKSDPQMYVITILADPTNASLDAAPSSTKYVHVFS